MTRKNKLEPCEFWTQSGVMYERWTCLTPRYRAGCENWGQVQFRGWRLACCPCVLRFPLAGGGERSAVMALQRDPWLQPSFHPATVTKLTFSSQGKPVRPWCTLLNWPLHCFGCSNGGSNFVHMHYKGSRNQIWSRDGIQKRKMNDCYNAFYFKYLHPSNLIRCEAGRLTYQIVVNKCMLRENVLVLIMSFMSYNWYDFRP